MFYFISRKLKVTQGWWARKVGIIVRTWTMNVWLQDAYSNHIKNYSNDIFSAYQNNEQADLHISTYSFSSAILNMKTKDD